VSTVPPTRNPKRQRKKEGAQARRAAELAALRKQQRNRRIVRIGLLAVVAVAAVLLISVLGGDDEEPVATEDTTTTVASDASTTTAAPIPATPLTCEGPSGENTDLAAKPTVPLPEAPATELTCQDLVVGTGDEALNTNDVVQVEYVGVGQASGEEFDSSWDADEPPAEFSLDGVIDGWTQGIPGMKVGGRRLLTIPGSLAYGAQGNPSAGIGPDETLVFVVDLIAVNPGS
jgi:peptidylprolyl isomerase